jgi:hypothetical protein
MARHALLLVQHAPLLNQLARQERMLARLFARDRGRPSPLPLRAGRLRARS